MLFLSDELSEKENKKISLAIKQNSRVHEVATGKKTPEEENFLFQMFRLGKKVDIGTEGGK